MASTVIGTCTVIQYRRCRELAMPQPRLLDQVRERIRVKHDSLRTEDAYLHWIRRFIRFHGVRHPRNMGAAEVEAFLSRLAIEGRVAASTQNQALSVRLFLYREVPALDLSWLDAIVRANRGQRLRVELRTNLLRSEIARQNCRTFNLRQVLDGIAQRRARHARVVPL